MLSSTSSPCIGCFRYDYQHGCSNCPMKIVGSRHEPVITGEASGEAIAAVARLSESLAALSKSTFIPKGVYRFRTHEAMNKHQDDCLALGMGLLAIERSRDRTDNPSGDT